MPEVGLTPNRPPPTNQIAWLASSHLPVFTSRFPNRVGVGLAEASYFTKAFLAHVPREQEWHRHGRTGLVFHEGLFAHVPRQDYLSGVSISSSPSGPTLRGDRASRGISRLLPADLAAWASAPARARNASASANVIRPSPSVSQPRI